MTEKCVKCGGEYFDKEIIVLVGVPYKYKSYPNIIIESKIEHTIFKCKVCLFPVIEHGSGYTFTTVKTKQLKQELT